MKSRMKEEKKQVDLKTFNEVKEKRRLIPKVNRRKKGRLEKGGVFMCVRKREREGEREI
jgi:hypothetical protein